MLAELAQLPGAGDAVLGLCPRAVPAFLPLLWIPQQELLAMEGSHPGTLLSRFGASTDTFLWRCGVLGRSSNKATGLAGKI